MSSRGIEAVKGLGIKYNVRIRIIDEPTGQVVSEHVGHNAATNTLLTGIGHYLAGEALTGQNGILDRWIPQYISLGTMGLVNQECDENGLPTGIGLTTEGSEEERFKNYLLTCPGYGSDGYDTSMMNNRPYAGLGPMFEDRPNTQVTANCELISARFPRSQITFRDVVPEHEAEIPKTIDVVYSAMISTGALAQFREEGKDYIFVSEVGLWSTPTWSGTGENGLLAGYRIAPPDQDNWDMSVEENRQILKKNIIRVGVNQIAQIVWKIQLGGIEQLGGLNELYPTETEGYMKWHVVL